MKLLPLYPVRFTYLHGWELALSSPASTEGQHFYLAEGTCEGRIQGKFRGANHPRRRGDGTYEPNFQGVIETGDGAVIFFNYSGYGRAYPVGRRQIVAAASNANKPPAALSPAEVTMPPKILFDQKRSGANRASSSSLGTYPATLVENPGRGRSQRCRRERLPAHRFRPGAHPAGMHSCEPKNRRFWIFGMSVWCSLAIDL